MHIDANKLANVRRDVMKKKRLKDAKHQEIKNEFKTVIKKIKEKFAVTEQPESESEDEDIFIGFDGERKSVMLKECKVVVQDLLCDTQERNDIHNEDQNNKTKDDKFIAKNFEGISKFKEYILNKLSNVRHTEIKEREPLRKNKKNKKNKRMTNLGNYVFESIVREMTVGMNEYNELVTPQLK